MARTRKNSDEQPIRIASEGPFSFDGDCTSVQLACRATRVDLAFLCNPMMAVYAFNDERPPHQITAAYRSMPPRQPVRLVIADDPGSRNRARRTLANDTKGPTTAGTNP